MLVLPKLFVPDFSWSSSQSSFSTKLLHLPLLLSGVWCFSVQACGQDAQWSPPVASAGNWNDAGNWTPGIPTGTATFDTANTTAVSLSGAVTIGTLQFNGTAPAYSFNNLGTLEITGLGVVNQSLNKPVFTNTGPGEVISFNNGSSAGNALITNAGIGLGTIFLGTSTAGAATITTTAGGMVEFAGASTGGTARFINQATGIFDMSSVTSGAMTAGSIEGAGNFFLGSRSLTVGLNNLNTTVSGPIEDGGLIAGSGASLIKVGAGTLTLTASNTYSGGTSINGGVIAVQVDSNLGTGPITLNGGTLEILAASGGITSNKPMIVLESGGIIQTDTGTTSTFSGAITGQGSLLGQNGFDKTGEGTLILSGMNTYSGFTNVQGGTLILGSSTALSPTGGLAVFGVVDLNGFNNTVAVLAGSGTITNNGIATANLTVGLNNSNGLTTFNGNLSDGEGVLQLTKVGLSALVLSGTNTYSGTTTVEGGVFQAGSTTAFSAASAFTVNGVLFLGGFSNTIGSLAGDGVVSNNSLGNGGLTIIRRNAAFGPTPATLTVGADNTSTVFSGIIKDGPSSSLALTKIGLGTLTLTGANRYSGGTTISGGMLQLGDVGVGGSIVGDVVDNAVLSFAGSDTLTLDGAISGHGTVQQNGSGTTILSGSNTYSGPTIVAAGILEAGSATAFSAASAFTVNAVLDLGGFSNTVGSLAGNGAVTNTGAGPATLSAGADNTSTLFSGVLANGSSVLALNKVGLGTFILTGANTYTGGTTISGGALQLGAGGVSGSIVGDVVDNAVLIFAHSDRLPFNAAISGTGSVQQNGPGTTILTGLNTYTGGTLVNAGTLTVGGPQALGFGDVVVDGGILNADPQRINVRGNYIQKAGGTLQLAVTGADPGQYDSLVINGNASLAGRLELFSLGFVPEVGNSLTLVSTGGAVSGKFGTVLSPFKPGGGVNTIEVIYEPKAVLLAFLHLAGPTPPVLPPGTPTPPGTPGMIVPISISLAQVSPEGLTAAFSIGFANAAIEMANLEDRLDALRAGCSDGFSSNMKLNGARTNPGGKEVVDGKAAPTAPEPIAAAGCLKWGAWVTGSGDFVTVDNDANAQGYNFTTGSVTLGLDYRLTDHLAIGVMGEYSHTWTGLKPAGHMDVDSGRGGLYGTWYDHRLYVNGGIFAGHSTYDTSRSNAGGLSSGSTEGSEWSTFIGGGYDFHFRALSVGPIASLQYTSVNLDGFTERGSFLPLAIHSQSEESLRSDVGFRASYQCQIGKVMVRPAIKAAWEHEFKYSAFPITSSFADFSAPAVTFDGPKQGQDSAVVSAGVSAQLTSGVSVYVNYDGQLGRQNYSSDAVTGGFAISF